MEIPTTSTPRLPYLSAKAWNQGISFLHGSHHVAHTSTINTFPLKRSEETSPRPNTSLRLKLGRGFDSATLMEGFCSSQFGDMRQPDSRAVAKTTGIRILLFMGPPQSLVHPCLIVWAVLWEPSYLRELHTA